MDEKEIVTEQVTETVETTTEETPKMFTQEEVNKMMGERNARFARKEARIRKEYEEKYGHLEEVLKAGTGKESVEEVTDTFTQFYEKKGINIPKKPNYTAKDVEVLANAEAEEFISAGFEDVVEEVERLARLGVQNMTDRQKAVFKRLAEYRQSEEMGRELAQRGVTADVYNSKEFKEFQAKFSPKTPISEIYDLYNLRNPKKEIRTMGSMKQTQNPGVKDYYSPEEIERLTEDDLDDPKVWEAVRRSMTGQ